MKKHNLSATFFATHSTTLLEEIRGNPLFELGIHPNFNNILNKTDCRDYIQVLKDIKLIVPEAVSCRSHALTQSSSILLEYNKLGIKYDLNTFIPISSWIELKPYFYLNSILKIPHFFEDDLFISETTHYSVDEFLNYNGLKVFDFHPIHIFLNTDNIRRYHEAKRCNGNLEALQKLRNHADGIENFLQTLIINAKQKGFSFLKISEINLDNYLLPQAQGV